MQRLVIISQSFFLVYSILKGSQFYNFVQAREFANELRASTKAPKNPAVWLEGSNGSGHNGSSADTSTVSDAYSKMLTIFIPLLVDEVTSPHHHHQLSATNMTIYFTC